MIVFPVWTESDLPLIRGDEGQCSDMEIKCGEILSLKVDGKMTGKAIPSCLPLIYV